MNKQSNATDAARQSRTVILRSQRRLRRRHPTNSLLVPSPSSVRLEAEGLLSTLSLWHQAAVVPPAADLRVRRQGGGGRRRRGRGRDGGPVGRARRAPRPLTLVLVGPAVAPFQVVPAGRGLLLQVEDAVDGALQVLVQVVVGGAAAGKAGVVHVWGVRLAALGGEQRVSREGRLLRGGRPGRMLVHSERPSRSVPILPAQPLVATYLRLLVRALVRPLFRRLPVQERLEVVVVVLSGFDATAEHLVHLVQPLHAAPQAARLVARLGGAGVQRLPVSLLHLHAGDHRPLRGGAGGLVPGGRRRGFGVGQVFVPSARHARPDPGADVLPVGLPEGEAAGGLRGRGGGGRVVFEPARVVVIQRPVHLSGGRGAGRRPCVRRRGGGGRWGCTGGKVSSQRRIGLSVCDDGRGARRRCCADGGLSSDDRGGGGSG